MADHEKELNITLIGEDAKLARDAVEIQAHLDALAAAVAILVHKLELDPDEVMERFDDVHVGDGNIDPADMDTLDIERDAAARRVLATIIGAKK